MSASELGSSMADGMAAHEPILPTWPLLPTETEIYILPDGRVIIADLPAELAELLAQLGQIELDQPAIAGGDA